MKNQRTFQKYAHRNNQKVKRNYFIARGGIRL